MTHLPRHIRYVSLLENVFLFYLARQFARQQLVVVLPESQKRKKLGKNERQPGTFYSALWTSVMGAVLEPLSYTTHEENAS